MVSPENNLTQYLDTTMPLDGRYTDKNHIAILFALLTYLLLYSDLFI